jgi:HAD superfamily hydrolase (TIGR01490 family)
MMQPVAFFDIDGTVFRSSLLIALVNELVQAGIFPNTAKEAYAEAYDRWQNREGTYESYIDAVIASYLMHIKGVHYGTVADIGRAVVGEQSKHVYRYTRDLITELQADDYYIVAISQSPKSILDVFCSSYGFNKVYGRMYELGPTDRFTGIVADEQIIANKANIVSRVASTECITLDGSVAVGDTEGDISMLEMVDRPICFNPNRALFEAAKDHDWPIVVERKDVIYEL